MSAIPERDLVDRCFSAAHAAADEAADPKTKAIVYALEGVAHQIRDHDDTQFTNASALRNCLDDIGIILNGRDSGVA